MKFSIRDLLLVTVIVALAVGWGVDRGNLHSLLVREVYKHSLTIHELNELKSKTLPNSQAPAPNPPTR